jgi:hypothetical protein
MLSQLHVLAFGGDDWSPLFVLLLLVISFLIAFSAVNGRTKTEEQIRGFASSLGGSVVSGSFMEPPTIRLTIRGLKAWMSFGIGRAPETKLRVRIPSFTEGTLRILPDGPSRNFLEFLRERSCKVGDPLFDTHYRVQADPVGLIPRIFTPERTGEVVDTVRRLRACPGFSLRLEPGWLEIRVGECLTDVPVVLGMERTASEFVGYLMGAGHPGIQCGDVVERMAGLCPICTTVLAEPLVRCERCRSPHHKECFEYLGRCATFGCEPSPRRRAA